MPQCPADSRHTMAATNTLATSMTRIIVVILTKAVSPTIEKAAL